MQNDARRAEILSTLAKNQKPISATTLAAAYHVSRQSIVGDIALLRASGADIIATSRGYLLAAASRQPLLKKTIACRHDAAAIREELYIAVDEGCTVADVSVERRVRRPAALSPDERHPPPHPPLPRRGRLPARHRKTPCRRYPPLRITEFQKQIALLLDSLVSIYYTYVLTPVKFKEDV